MSHQHQLERRRELEPLLQVLNGYLYWFEFDPLTLLCGLFSHMKHTLVSITGRAMGRGRAWANFQKPAILKVELGLNRSPAPPNPLSINLILHHQKAAIQVLDPVKLVRIRYWFHQDELAGLFI